jgi:hypothetical protein
VRRAAAVPLVLGTAAALLAARGPTAPRHVEAPPTAHTGGFGEPTCLECHSEFDANLPDGRLMLLGLPEAYEAGRTYALTVRLESEEMVKAGFQISSRFEAGRATGRAAGMLAAVDERSSVTHDSVTSVPYAHHTRAGTPTADPSVATWTLAWTAPSASADVVFHLAANSANGDDSPLGDLIYTTLARSKGSTER